MECQYTYVNILEDDAKKLSIFKGTGQIVYNAPRPIPGETCWEGKFRHGIFYSASAITEARVKILDKLDGREVVLITNAEVMTRLCEELANSKYPERMRKFMDKNPIYCQRKAWDHFRMPLVISK